MALNPLNHPPGTIAMAVGDQARYHQFTYSLACLQQPPGTTLAMVRSCAINPAMNAIVDEMLQGEWMWIIADDHVFDAGLLVHLLQRDVDVVVPVCWKRTPPFQLVHYRPSDIDDDGRRLYMPYAPRELPIDGRLMEVEASGNAGMLIRRHVLDELDRPIFANSHGHIQNEDVELCRKIREAGYTIWLDTAAHLGHIASAVIWPLLRDGEWGLKFDFGGGCEIGMAHRDPVEVAA